VLFGHLVDVLGDELQALVDLLVELQVVVQIESVMMGKLQVVEIVHCRSTPV